MTASSYHPAALALQGLFTLANETEREIARSLGLNLTDYRALSALAQSGPVTVGKLAEDLGATPATTTAIVSRMEARGYMERHRNTEDRRQVQVSVTPAASHEIMNLMRPLMTATNEHLQALPAAPPDRRRGLPRRRPAPDAGPPAHTFGEGPPMKEFTTPQLADASGHTKRDRAAHAAVPDLSGTHRLRGPGRRTPRSRIPGAR